MKPDFLAEPTARLIDTLAGVEAWTNRWELHTRTLFLFGEVAATGGRAKKNDDLMFVAATSIEYLVAGMLLFDSINHEPIRLLINSPGGDITAGLALIATMRDIESPVHTVVQGEAASIAAVIAVAGDKRLAYPHARWLLHRGKTQPREGDADDILITGREFKVLDGIADLVIVNFSKIPPDKLKRMQMKDKWLGAPEALKWGLIDEVIEPRKGPKVWLPDKAFLKSLREKEDEEDEQATAGEGGA